MFSLCLFYVSKSSLDISDVISMQRVEVQSSSATRHHILPKHRAESHGTLTKLLASDDCHIPPTPNYI